MIFFNRKSDKDKLKKIRGFTLIELMVASSLFVVVMLMSSGAILSVFDANQKAKTLRSVMDNLNLSMESMTRTIRFGKNYHCGAGGTLSSPLDCGGAGNTSLTVLEVSGIQTTYALSSGRILRTKNGVNGYMTSPDVTISNLNFWVYGSNSYTSGDTLQPQVIMIVTGYVGADPSTRSYFTLQTTISQRDFDFQ